MTDTPTTTPDELEQLDDTTRGLLDELDGIAEYLEPVEQKYARRAEIMVQLRERKPPVKHRIIAEAARSSEDAVIQTVRKARGK